MNFFHNPYSSKTWEEHEEFSLQTGEHYACFRDRFRKRALSSAIKVGDIFLEHIGGLVDDSGKTASRFVGASRIISKATVESKKIFSDEIFPIRFRVEPIIKLPIMHGLLSQESLLKRLSVYKPGTNHGYLFQQSMRQYAVGDGELIFNELIEISKSELPKSHAYCDQKARRTREKKNPLLTKTQFFKPENNSSLKIDEVKNRLNDLLKLKELLTPEIYQETERKIVETLHRGI